MGFHRTALHFESREKPPTRAAIDQMRYLLSVYAGLVLGAVAGGLLGFVVDQATGLAGWSLTLGSLGACLGACWAGLRRAEGKLISPTRPRPANVGGEGSDEGH